MDVARVGPDYPAKSAVGFVESTGGDGVDNELAALEQCLGGARHPLPPLLRKRALEMATGISARAPASACLEVNLRLRAALRRHGIFRNDLRPR